jgi:polyhydroxybutyrate depolymerase
VRPAALLCSILLGCAAGVRLEPDAGTQDSGPTDSGTADAGIPDAGTPDAGQPDAGSPDGGAWTGTLTVLGRPYHLHVPSGYAPGRPASLLVMFHGYASTALRHEAWLRLTELSDERAFLYAYPEGLADQLGYQFWNATDACCDLYGKPADDSYFAATLIADVRSRYSVDPKRIFLVGHSNGGFMAHRMACDLATDLAAVVSLSGMTWKDASKCAAQDRIAILQIHGDADPTIDYNGGRVSAPWMAPYPSAHETVATWAAIDGCGALQATGETRDIVPGLQTTVERYSGCAAGAVELWTVHGGKHMPDLSPLWYEPVWSFLAAHPKR